MLTPTNIVRLIESLAHKTPRARAVFYSEVICKLLKELEYTPIAVDLKNRIQNTIELHTHWAFTSNKSERLN